MRNIYFILFLFIPVIFISCSKTDDEKLNNPEGVFISINNDSRELSLVNEPGYEIDIRSRSLFDYNQGGMLPVIGKIFEMNIKDENRKYIGGIADITSCVEIRIFVVILEPNIENYSSYETFLLEIPSDTVDYECDYYCSLNVESNMGKCYTNIMLLDDSGQNIINGYSQSNQTISVERELGEFKLEFNNLVFKDEEETFSASCRIITN